MQDGHLLIVRYYFYPTGRNKSIVRKLCVFALVNNKDFLEGLPLPASQGSGTTSETALSPNEAPGFQIHFS